MKELNDCPIINLEIDDEVVFSPTDYFNYKRNAEGHNIPDIPSNCIICFEKTFVNYAEQHLGIEKITWFRKEFELYKLKNKDMIIVNINYGAALSAIALEELIALGVKQFIVIGSAGTLQETIPLGALVIAESAIREEGVSYHYLKPSKHVNCSKQLADKAKEIIQKTKADNIFFGATWTTDSFYMESISKTKKYKAENVLSVDMETAALYAVAKYRGVDILSIFYISDSIAELRWNPEFHKTNSEKIQSIMLNLAIKILA